jgi:hypothetical protein
VLYVESSAARTLAGHSLSDIPALLAIPGGAGK